MKIARNADAPKNPPEVLYVYRSFRRDMKREAQTIRNGLIYFSTPDQFNDPFEVRPVIRFPRKPPLPTATRIDAQYRHRYPDMEPDEREQLVAASLAGYRIGLLKPQLLPDAHERVLAMFRQTSIACFAASATDVRMWSYYATKHQGYCLGFNSAGWTFQHWSGATVEMPAREVRYGHRYPVIVHGWNTESEVENLRVIRDALLTKARGWIHEDEWRYLRFDTPSGLQPYPTGALKSMILGVEMPLRRRRNMVALARDRHRAIEIFQAVRQPNRFALTLEPL